jgi:hypothetical protein
MKTNIASSADPDKPFLLRVLVGLFTSTILTGGIAVSLAVRILNEPSIQVALN